MKGQLCFFTILIIAFFFAFSFTSRALTKKNRSFEREMNTNPYYSFHQDSIHHLNFRYPDKRRGINPFIVPGLLITGGTVLHFSDDLQLNFQDWVQKHTSYNGNIEEYLPYAPLVAVYGLNALGVKGENNFGNRTAIAAKSYILNAVIVKGLKKWTDTERPNGRDESFPSGHTSVAFAMAHFMHKEYGGQNPWYSIGAYVCATTTAALRVMKNSHWIGDVVVGAGIGMLSTELIYLTHLYKWDNEHLGNFDIFPFQVGRQKGLTMVYNF